MDGTHCLTRELKHATLSKDPKNYSHNFHKPGVDYEIALDLWSDRVVWISGPFPASQPDIKSLVSQTVKTLKNCESSSAVPDRAKRLSTLELKTLRSLTLDFATTSRSTNPSLKRSALSSNTSLSSDPPCSWCHHLGYSHFYNLSLLHL